MLTPKGITAAGAAFGLLVAGALAAGPLAFVLGLGLAAVLAAGRLRVRPRRLAVTRRGPQGSLVEEDEADVRLAFANLGARPVLATYRDALPTSARVPDGLNAGDLVLPPRGEASLAYRVRFPLKGEHRIGPLLVRFEDPLRNFAVEQGLGHSEPLLVHPRRLLVDDFSAPSQYAAWFVGQHLVNRPGHGMDFFGLRDYQAGDRLRDVNWKASARRSAQQPLIVSQRTRESYAEVVLVLDATRTTGLGWETYSPLAQGCRGALTLLAWVQRRRDDCRLLVVQDLVHEVHPGGPDRQTVEALALLTSLEPTGTQPVGALLEARLGQLQPRSPVILVTPLEDDATWVDLAGDLRARGHRVSALIPSPTFQTDGARPGAGEPSPHAREAMDRLRALEVTVVPWSPDRPLALAVQEVIS